MLRENMEVFVDTREVGSGFIEMLKKFVTVKTAMLEVGDVSTDHVVIERKSINDFATSLVNGRLFEQMNKLMREQEISKKVCVLIIHGWRPTINIEEKHLFGAISSVCVHYGFPILWVPDLETCAHVAWKVIEKVHEGKWLTPRHVYKREPRRVPQSVLRVRKLLGVPDRVAAGLLVKFGSIRNMCCASVEELLSVPGIGKIRARRIHSVLNFDYRKSGKHESKETST